MARAESQATMPPSTATSRQTLERYVAFLRADLRLAMIELYGAEDLRFFIFPDPKLQTAIDSTSSSERAKVVLTAINA